MAVSKERVEDMALGTWKKNSWFEKFISETCDNSPDEDSLYMHSSYTKKDIYKTFVGQMPTLGRSKEQIIKASCFANIWSKQFAHMYIAPVSGMELNVYSIFF